MPQRQCGNMPLTALVQSCSDFVSVTHRRRAFHSVLGKQLICYLKHIVRDKFSE